MWNHRNHEMFSNGKVDTLSGEELLKRAIQRELSMGLQELSPLYSNYFNTDTRRMFNKSITHMKQWLVIIRQGRMATRISYTDKIERNPTVPEWIGLIRNDTETAPPQR